MTEIEIGAEGIRLGQLLKYAGVVDTGGEAKDLLASGLVAVNGVAETRRGAQLAAGDVVSVDGAEFRLR
jgi:ribosome-associated protein